MPEKLLDNLNEEQKQAVTYDSGPLLIVAGAGTGKTTVIAKRLAHLIETGRAKSDEILALTFTEKAAGEMEERVDRLLPYGYLDLWVSTFHSFGERILKSHALEIGLPDDFKLYSQTQQWLLIRNNLNRFNLDYYRPLGNPTKFIAALVRHFSRVKDEMISPEDYLKYAEELELNKDAAQDGLIGEEASRLKEIASAYHVYQQLLLEENALDFGDLINYTLKLFQTRPLILEKYRKQFKYVLVDEFQDTNYAQYELVKLLSAPQNNLTVCADDDQSIYKFRGASVSNIFQFKKDFPDSREIFLLKNYRSCQNILDLSYKFIQLNNPNRLEWQLNNLQPKTHSSKQLNKKLVAQKDGEGIVNCLYCRTQEEEARKVVEKIINLHESYTNGHELTANHSPLSTPHSSLTWNDFAILTRANSHAEIFCQALNQAEIPYQFMASAGLFNKPIILDILAYLKLLDNYHESPSLYRVLNLPVFEISGEDLYRLTYQAHRKSWSLYETLKKSAALNLSPETAAQISKLLSWIEKHTQMAREKNVGYVLLNFLEDSGYLKLLSQEQSQKNMDNLSYLNQFFRKVEEFERANADRSIKNFMDYLDLTLESGDKGGLKNDLEEGPESVKVMTVHGAKGLEFKYVFIVNLADRRFPTDERKEAIELPDALVKEIIPEGDIHLEEERRLFYVAMTRAEDGLFFALAENYGGARAKKPSRFLKEIGLADLEEKKPEKSGGQYLDYFKKPLVGVKTADYKFSVPDQFSFTQLKVFETCPLQYKFAHLLHIPVEGRPTFSFGQTIHLTLQKFFQRILERQESEQTSLFAGDKKDAKPGTIPVSLDELLEIYEEVWIDDWYGDQKREKDYKAQGEKSLKNFYKHLQEDGLPDVRFLEMGFNFKIGGQRLKGRIDRVDALPGGRLEIIDYKTGQSKEKLDSEDKRQLLIYQVALREIFQEKIEKLTFYYLDDNKKVSFLGDENDLSKLKEKIAGQMEEIKAAVENNEFPPKPGFFCQSCDFRRICEYRQL